MLVLSRKVGERVVISDTVTLTVNRVQGNRVTLGVEAPKEMAIRRSELVIECGRADGELPLPGP